MLHFTRRKMLVLFCAVALFVYVAESQEHGARIIGGRDADIEEVPYQAAIFKSNIHWCGASIITRRAVVTAAHCVVGDPFYILEIGVGSANVNQVIRYAVHKYDLHEYYNYKIHDSDIALVWSSRSFIFSNNVRPIRLPAQGEEPNIGHFATVTGWGKLKINNGYAKILQLVKVPIVDYDTCKASYYYLTANMLCAGYEYGGKDACQADSGGPLVVDGKLHGVVSHGWGCALPHAYGVYAKVSQFRHWIENKLEENL